jgi:hypothetical protein
MNNKIYDRKTIKRILEKIYSQLKNKNNLLINLHTINLIKNIHLYTCDFFHKDRLTCYDNEKCICANLFLLNMFNKSLHESNNKNYNFMINIINNMIRTLDDKKIDNLNVNNFNNNNIEQKMNFNNNTPFELDENVDSNQHSHNVVFRPYQYPPMSFDSLTAFEMVGQFHQVFGHPIRETINPNIYTENPSLIEFRLRLINEELNELIDSHKNLYHNVDINNIENIKKYYGEIMDACGDLTYVINGMLHVIGYNYDKHDSYNFYNFRKENSQMFHPTSFYQYNISSMLLTNLKNAYENIFINKHDIKVLIGTSCYMLSLIKSFSDLLCFDLDEVNYRVHSSNMTKLCYSLEEVEKTIESYKKKYLETNEPNFKFPTCKVIVKDKIFMICNFDPSKGQECAKVLKSINFKIPDFTDLIDTGISF